jgi:hypothetical protein
MTAPSGEFLRITATTSGMERVIDRLLRVERNITDLTPVWPDVVMAFRAIETRAFETEGGSTDSGSWPELAESTVAERARARAGAGEGFGEGGPAHPILQRSGKLKRALTLEGVNSNVVTTPTSLRYTLSEQVSYFAFHQSTGARHRLPRRAPVSLTEADRQALMRPIRLFVAGNDPSVPTREAVA